MWQPRRIRAARKGRPWRTVARLGVGIAIAMVAGQAVINRVLDIVQGRVSEAIDDRGPTPAAATTGPILEALTDGLRPLTGIVVVARLVLAVVGFLMGTSTTATRARAWIARPAATASSSLRRALAGLRNLPVPGSSAPPTRQRRTEPAPWSVLGQRG